MDKSHVEWQQDSTSPFSKVTAVCIRQAAAAAVLSAGNGEEKKRKTLEIGKYILGVNSCVEEGELEAQTRDKKHRDKGNSVWNLGWD